MAVSVVREETGKLSKAGLVEERDCEGLRVMVEEGRDEGATENGCHVEDNPPVGLVIGRVFRGRENGVVGV